MRNDEKISLLAKIARTNVRESAERDLTGSILSLAAASYGAQPDAESTVPTGFDPAAVALFEAIVEAAYLVAAADGVVDEEERRTFERVVTAACGGTVAPKHVSALVSDLRDQLHEDGLDRRIAAVGHQVTKRTHAHEVLRIAALLARASENVSDDERSVLERIATACGLMPSDVDVALHDVDDALATA